MTVETTQRQYASRPRPDSPQPWTNQLSKVLGRSAAELLADHTDNPGSIFQVSGQVINMIYLCTTEASRTNALYTVSDILERATIRCSQHTPLIAERLRGHWDLVDWLLGPTDQTPLPERVERIGQLLRDETTLTKGDGYYRLGMDIMAILDAPDLAERVEALRAMNSPLRRAASPQGHHTQKVRTHLSGMLDVTEPMLASSEADLLFIRQVDALSELAVQILQQVEGAGFESVTIDQLVADLGQPRDDITQAVAFLRDGSREFPDCQAALALKAWLATPESHPVARVYQPD